jgi:hypothetical protein
VACAVGAADALESGAGATLPPPPPPHAASNAVPRNANSTKARGDIVMPPYVRLKSPLLRKASVHHLGR